MGNSVLSKICEFLSDFSKKQAKIHEYLTEMLVEHNVQA
jgi:hypothetical protein